MEKVETVEEYFPGTKTLWERCETRGGEKHGTREVFYKNGGIRIRTKYVEGKRHGTREEFYESGGIEIRTEYVEDKQHGLLKKYSPEGDLILDIVLEDGMQINLKDALNVTALDMVTDFLDELPSRMYGFGTLRPECGTVASAVGWFPSIFPELEYTGSGLMLGTKDGLNYEEVGSCILNVSEAIVFDLFSPQSEISELFPTLPVCGSDATPKEVSAKLKAFKELVMVA